MNRVVQFVQKHRFYILLSSITVFSFVYMAVYAGEKSLWYDDIYQIYFTWDKTLGEAMKHVNSVDLNPPLWAFFTYFWQRIAPFGTFWLKLPSVIFVCCGIFFIGLSTKKIFSEKAAVVAALLAAFHPSVVTICGFSYRSYGAMFFFSSFLVYTFIRRYLNPSRPNRILFTVSIFLIAFTHYFGALLCVFFAVFDFLLCLKGRQKKSFIIEYMIVGCLELPWLLTQLSNITNALTSFWPSKPTFRSFFELLKELTINSYVFLVVFLVLVAVTIFDTVKRLVKKQAEDNVDTLAIKNALYIIPIVFLFSIMMLSLLTPKTSLWVPRYFYFLIPLIIVFISAALVDVFKRLIDSSVHLMKYRIAIVTGLFISLLIALVPKYITYIPKESKTEYEPFERAAEIVMSQPEIVTGEKVLLFNTTPCAKGWEYYLGKKNTRSLDNIDLIGNLEFADTPVSSYDTVFIYAVHLDGDIDLEKELDELSHTHNIEIVDAHYNIYKLTKKIS